MQTRRILREPFQECPIIKIRKRHAIFGERRANGAGQLAPGARHQAHEASRRRAFGPQAKPAMEQREDQADVTEEGGGLGHGRKRAKARMSAGLIAALFANAPAALGVLAKHGVEIRRRYPTRRAPYAAR
jgi:hypothetical protein